MDPCTLASVIFLVCGLIAALVWSSQKKQLGKILCKRCGHIGSARGLFAPFRGVRPVCARCQSEDWVKSDEEEPIHRKPRGKPEESSMKAPRSASCSRQVKSVPRLDEPAFPVKTHLDCPICQERYAVDASLAGKTVRCRICKEPFRIPNPLLPQRLSGSDFDAPSQEELNTAKRSLGRVLGWTVIGLVALALVSAVNLGAFLIYLSPVQRAKDEACQLAAQRQERITMLEGELAQTRNHVQREKRERHEEQRRNTSALQHARQQQIREEQSRDSLKSQLEKAEQECMHLKAEADEERRARAIALEKRKKERSEEAERSINEYIDNLDSDLQILARNAKTLLDKMTCAYAKDAESKDVAMYMKQLVAGDTDGALALRLAAFGRNYVPMDAGQVTWGEAWAAGLKTLKGRLTTQKKYEESRKLPKMEDAETKAKADEAAAAQKLKFAKALSYASSESESQGNYRESARLVREYRNALREIIENYPTSKEAKEAKKLLGE